MKKNFEEFKDFICNKNVAVVGIGISNTPLIKFLLDLKAKVTAFDKKTEDELGEIGEELKNKGVKLQLSDKYLENLSGFDVIFKTPSMRIDSPELIKAKEEGTYITSEMQEFVKYCPAKIYGITGSDGKTTTTSIIYNMLKEEGYKVWVGGNIGMPLFSHIEEIQPQDKVVLELSSFQLMTMNVSTDIAVITNLSPNHLDMHKDMEEYVEAKKNIFKYGTDKDRLVLNMDNKITNNMANESKGSVMLFSRINKLDTGAYYDRNSNNLYVMNKKVCNKDEIVIKGMHNVENYLAAFCAVYDEVSIENMRKVALNFNGVEHRCEFVRELNGVKFYNDSIASSPSRTIAGLKAFDRKVILIAGGYDKKIPFAPLAIEGYPFIKNLILVGKTKYLIRDAFKNIEKEKNISIPTYIVDTFQEAIYKAKELAEKGDIVTLSPSCASFDMFANFEVRGNEFKKIVNNLE